MKNKILFLLLSIALLFVACKRSDRDLDTATNSSQDELTAQYISLDILRMVDFAVRNNKGFYATASEDTLLYNCYKIQADTVNKIISIIFNANCKDKFGYTKFGSIKASFSKDYDSAGCVVTIDFNQYKINDYMISGTIMYVVQSINNYGQQFEFQPDIKVSNSDTSMYWSANYLISPKSGANTMYTSDDTYLISGRATGRAFKGNEYKSQITGSLLFSTACAHITAGSGYLTPGNLSQRVINFGDGACDNSYTVNINGTIYKLKAF